MKNTNLKSIIKIASSIILVAILGLTMSCASGPKVDPPPAPQNVTATQTVTPRTIVIKWDAVEGATKYRVNGAPTMETTDTTFTMSVSPNQMYNITVQAFIGRVAGATSTAVQVRTSPETAAEKVAREERERRAAAEAERRAAEAAAREQRLVAEAAPIVNSPHFKNLEGRWGRDRQSLGGNQVSRIRIETSGMTMSGDRLNPQFVYVIGSGGTILRITSITANTITSAAGPHIYTINYSVSGNTLTISNATRRNSNGAESLLPGKGVSIRDAIVGTYTR